MAEVLPIKDTLSPITAAPDASTVETAPPTEPALPLKTTPSATVSFPELRIAPPWSSLLSFADISALTASSSPDETTSLSARASETAKAAAINAVVNKSLFFIFQFLKI